MNRIIGDCALKRKIGGGSFGNIYIAQDIKTGEEVAIKIEDNSTPQPQLLRESKFYRLISGEPGFPEFKWYKIDGDNAVMAMELLGQSVAELLELCHGKFSLKTVLMLADQMISRLEYVHSKGYIHRDIKPDNFAIGLGKKHSIIFLFDFGLSKKYIDVKTGTHIPYKEDRELTGTARYSSVSTHLGIEQSRRDDLEALAYVLIFFLKGRLPWQGQKAESQKQKNKLIAEVKCTTPIEELCSDLPKEFSIFLEEVRKLGFQDKPDYEMYRELFRNLFIQEGFVFDYQYDWDVKKDDMISQHSAIPKIVYPGMAKLMKFRSSPHIIAVPQQRARASSLIKDQPTPLPPFSKL
ncbi:CK1 family protein kinase [Trichomonas vaginalis G3]|uniref:CK1 family protein kinase n=1 Tax=Trichomonas vaginalis (strain ATCC PRA-98 / G3) TaxID=412133 RepID=A2F2F3_TRIV3|nr:STKc CK1 domain-containing protein [Trichomonas vaginalis G3]EAY00919.1 CK1 family protein kinase [Trichomonas vaginalis G3]KAI5554158.1 STKc CK1 domain-containing protein [Trichomonas vaginalis G3]|eukprot:XP_001313848.1 CK1 family protein kinase [Trichomonas vaginalis G3]